MRRTLIIAAWGCWLCLLGAAVASEPRAGDGTNVPPRPSELRQSPATRNRPAAAAPQVNRPLSYSLSSDDLPSEAANASAVPHPAAELRLPSEEAAVEPYHDGDQFAECCDDGHRHCFDWINWDDCDCCMLLKAVGRLPIEARGEYLMWWVEGQATPPLVTTSPPDTPRPQAGVLNQLNTTILFGNDSSLNDEQRSGGRFNIKWWYDDENAIEADWFGLGELVSEFHAASDGSTILARPFFNLSTGAQDSFVVAYPGQLAGSIDIRATSSLIGTNLGVAKTLYCSERCRNDVEKLNILYGFRFMRMTEVLDLQDELTVIEPDGVIEQGTKFATFDQFKTVNNFYGLSLGLSGERQLNRWALTGVGRLGLGVTNERVTIFGASSTSDPQGVTENFAGGLLALPTNIGSFTRNQLAFVPQLEFKAAYLVTQHFRLTAGYDIMYWSSVVRPGQQIDTVLNTTQASGEPLVGEPAPLFQSRQTDVWIQGINFGAEWHF